MIAWSNTKLIMGNRQRFCHVWVECNYCGDGRWVVKSDAKRLSDGQPCRTCSNIRAWDGNRIDLSDNKKACSDCGEYKPLSEFSADIRKRAGVRSYCLTCAAKRTEIYRRDNPDKSKMSRRIAQSLRRARTNKSNGRITARDWETVLERYDRKCLSCGRVDDLQIDHVIPISKGGAHVIGNIQPLCGSCNRKKQARIIDYR